MRMIYALPAVLLFVSSAFAQTAPTSRPTTRVACIGDSITFGAGTKDRHADSYPSVLGRMLGAGYEVQNFGVSGATALSHSNLPYAGTKRYPAAQAFRPDVVVAMLGTNDSKHPTTQFVDSPDNWSRKADFVADYRAILASFRAANPDVKLYVATPVPAFSKVMWGINGDTIHEEIVPMTREVARAERATVIDLHAALDGQADKFPDTVHPNEAGARMMAAAVYAGLTGRPAPATYPTTMPARDAAVHAVAP